MDKRIVENYKGYDILSSKNGSFSQGGEYFDYYCTELDLHGATLETIKRSIDKAIEYDNDGFESIGYMAKRLSDNILFPFTWNEDDTFIINGHTVNIEDYEVVEVFLKNS